MSTVVHVGTADLPQGSGWERYFAKLSFIETTALVPGPVRPAVVAKMRAAAPGPGSFSLVAPPIESDLTAFLASAAVLEPSALVFRTPASFSPSATNRDKLRAFFAELPPVGDAVRVWQPDGLWDTRTAVKLAGELDVVYGVDPLVRDQTREPPDFFATLEATELYFRVTGLGRGARKLGSSQVEELSEIVASYERSWVVFATADSLPDAARFARGLRDAPDDPRSQK
jgi:uncharacterized protein YecE (DUF72 family)